MRFIAKKELIMTHTSIPTPKRVALGSARTNTKASLTGDRAESNHIMQYNG